MKKNKKQIKKFKDIIYSIGKSLIMFNNSFKNAFSLLYIYIYTLTLVNYYNYLSNISNLIDKIFIIGKIFIIFHHLTNKNKNLSISEAYYLKRLNSEKIYY